MKAALSAMMVKTDRGRYAQNGRTEGISPIRSEILLRVENYSIDLPLRLRW